MAIVIPTKAGLSKVVVLEREIIFSKNQFLPDEFRNNNLVPLVNLFKGTGKYPGLLIRSAYSAVLGKNLFTEKCALNVDNLKFDA